MTTRDCPNSNHTQKNPPVRFCPDCGESVNPTATFRLCDEQAHAKKRRQGCPHCVDCGVELI